MSEEVVVEYDKAKLDAIPRHPKNSALRGLSWYELKYLKDRGILTEEQERLAGFAPVPGLGGTYPPEAEEHEEVAVEEPPDEDDYDSWTNDQLKDEIRTRNEVRSTDDQIKLTGSHAELVARLEADDEA